MKKTILTIVLIITVLITIHSQDTPEFILTLEIEDALAKVAEKSAAISLTPNNDLLYNERGMYYNILRMFEEALNDFNTAIRLNPDNGSYYASRGMIYNNTGKFQEAVDDITRAIDLGYNIPRLSVMRGNTFHEVPLVYMRATAYVKLLNYEKAAEDYSYLLIHDSNSRNHENYFFSRAYIFFTLGKYHEAFEDINKAIEYNQRDVRYYFYRGRINDLLNKFQESLADYTKALTIKPGDVDSLYHRSLIYAGLSMPNRALSDINQAFKTAPADMLGKLYGIRGMVYTLKRNVNRALADLNKAINLDPTETVYLNMRAGIYEMLAKKALRISVRDEYLRRAKRDYTAVEELKRTNLD